MLFAVTFHEIAHGWMANRLGDSTARQLGRLSPNPIRHIDPLGTILVPALMYVSTGYMFGWAKPVPVNWQNLRNPRRDVALVALAGPLANLVMALIWAMIIKTAASVGPLMPTIAELLIYMGLAGIIINSILLVLNLFPIPPLDGSRVLSALLPPDLARLYLRIEPFGLIVLVILLLSGVLGQWMQPFIAGMQRLALMLA